MFPSELHVLVYASRLAVFVAKMATHKRSSQALPTLPRQLLLHAFHQSFSPAHIRPRPMQGVLVPVKSVKVNLFNGVIRMMIDQRTADGDVSMGCDDGQEWALERFK